VRDSPSVICIGGGPAGLTAAYLLSGRGAAVTVIDRDPVHVGGLAKTVQYKGFRFDIGGHRFFSKSAAVEALWSEILGPDLLDRPRKSRIYYRGKLFAYPLRTLDVLAKLGLAESAACLLSYARARLAPVAAPRNFEEWVSNRFGKRLFRIFFKTYTEKVWGMKCTEISADWAAQRIKSFSLGAAIRHAVLPRRRRAPQSGVVTTLIDKFRYPRRGPGMMWEAATAKIRAQGGAVHLGLEVVETAFDATRQLYTVTARDGQGRQHCFSAEHVISSAAIRDLFAGLRPAPPEAAARAAAALRYRDFLVVALVLEDRGLFDDNWIYIHEPGVKVGRIQNFKSWSPEMVPDQRLNCYGLEYFCFEGDELWRLPDEDLIAMARRELVQLGLARAEDISDGCVIRQPKAYPVYDDAYQEHVATVRRSLALYPNLHLVGRNGMHKYNNQDHAMMTAMLTVENILAGTVRYDAWRVNEDAEYLEEDAERRPAGDPQPGRRVPARVSPAEPSPVAARPG
jgi:protoporphyrinogen oxidase